MTIPGPGRWRGGWPVLAVGLLLLFTSPCLPGAWVPLSAGESLAGQEGQDLRSLEARVLREVGGREVAGDPAGAELLLRSFLGEQPASAGALFALERILRSQGRLIDLLPLVDRAVDSRAGGTPIRYLKLRLLVETDSVEAVEPELERWIAEEPGSVDPFREGARALERARGPEAALALLQRGMEGLGRAWELELDAGDVLLRSGDGPGAAEWWARGLGDDPVQLPTLLRRLQGREGAERMAVISPLVQALAREPTTPARLQAGVTLALAGQLPSEARALAERTRDLLQEAARNTFLSQLAEDAEAAGDPPLQLWAMQSQRETSAPSDARVLEGEIARLALFLGDTATALAAWNREAEAWPRGSSERRRALVAALALEVNRAPPGEVQHGVNAFRNEFPGGTELDEVASILARSLLARGDSTGAWEMLRQTGGPAAARERALLALAGPTPREARDDLLAAAAGLPQVQATELLQLVSLLDVLGGDAGRVAAGASLLALKGDPHGGAARIVEGLLALPARDRAPLLAMAARMADSGGDRERAGGLWQQLVDEHPDAAEVGEAVLSLARWKASTPAGVSGAIVLLEEFIVSRPQSPAVPEARRHLTRLRRSPGHGGLP